MELPKLQEILQHMVEQFGILEQILQLEAQLLLKVTQQVHGAMQLEVQHLQL